MSGGGGPESEQVCQELSLFTLFISQTLFIVLEQSPRVRGGGAGAYTFNNNYTADRTLFSVLVLQDVKLVIKLVIKSREGEGSSHN